MLCFFNTMHFSGVTGSRSYKVININFCKCLTNLHIRYQHCTLHSSEVGWQWQTDLNNSPQITQSGGIKTIMNNTLKHEQGSFVKANHLPVVFFFWQYGHYLPFSCWICAMNWSWTGIFHCQIQLSSLPYTAHCRDVKDYLALLYWHVLCILITPSNL